MVQQPFKNFKYLFKNRKQSFKNLLAIVQLQFNNPSTIF